MLKKINKWGLSRRNLLRGRACVSARVCVCVGPVAARKCPCSDSECVRAFMYVCMFGARLCVFRAS